MVFPWFVFSDAMSARVARFELGQVVVTPTAAAAIEATGQTLEEILARHQSGDWGNVPDTHRLVNEEGVSKPFTLQSVYDSTDGIQIAVVTRADRSLTMVHLSASGPGPSPSLRKLDN